MLKKFIAGIIYLTFFSTAVAEPNIQIYGVVDYGYSLMFDRLGDFKISGISVNAKELGYTKTNSRFDSGQAVENYLGFKGEENLGNGIKALFVLERGINLDSGTDENSFDKQAYIGINGNFGTIIGGLIYTPYYLLISDLDPFDGATILQGDMSSRPYKSSDTVGPIRIKNAIAYFSPNWNGFDFSLVYSNNIVNDDNNLNNNSNDKLYAMAVNYSSNNWKLGLSYHYISYANNNSAELGNCMKNMNDFVIGGAYDFKFAKISSFIAYDIMRCSEKSIAINNKKSVKQIGFMLGAEIPFGKHAVKSSFNYSHNNKNQFGNSFMLAFGYEYNFSQRTNFYTNYEYIHNDKANEHRFGRVNTVYSIFSSGLPYQQGLQIGIKHSF